MVKGFSLLLKEENGKVNGETVNVGTLQVRTGMESLLEDGSME